MSAREPAPTESTALEPIACRHRMPMSTDMFGARDATAVPTV